MSEGFWSLRNAPKWWFNKNSLWVLAAVIVVTVAWKVAYGPGRVPAGQVVFYSASYCGYSTALREYLQAANIPFQERSIEDSFGNVLRYMAAAGRGGRLPLVQVGPTVVSKGLNRGDINRALIDAGFKPPPWPQGPEGGTERR
jgi:hypothetical protein